MKIFRFLLCLLLVGIVLVFVLYLPTQKIKPIAYTELGIPSADQYDPGVRARSPWDMTVWDDFLYVGSGDFDANAGPVAVIRRNLTTMEWETGAPLPEEEIDRFCVIDGKLTIPGIDPQESWEFGNYYVLNDGEWVKHRTIPDGVHTFDLVEFDGKIFAGIGAPEEYSPIVASSDDGETFSHVDLYKNGEKLDTTQWSDVRTYNLFTLRGNLYAFILFRGAKSGSVEIYRYSDGTFAYDNTWSGKIRMKSITYIPLSAKYEYNGKLFFATGNLYVTDDANEIRQISFPDGTTVYDLVESKGKLYALCGEPQEDGTIRVSVWANSKKKDEAFSELFYFFYEIPPLSLAVDRKTFFVGLSDTHAENEKNGMILQIEYK